MPAKIARLATRPLFWIPEVSVAVRSSRPSCSKAENREYSWQIGSHPGNPGSRRSYALGATRSASICFAIALGLRRSSPSFSRRSFSVGSTRAVSCAPCHAVFLPGERRFDGSSWSYGGFEEAQRLTYDLTLHL